MKRIILGIFLSIVAGSVLAQAPMVPTGPITAAQDFPGYIVGNWYVPPQIPQLASGSNPTAGSIRLYPGYIKQQVTINSLGVRINTLAAGGNVQLAIYANNPATGRPTGTALASTASITTAAAGNFNSAVSVQLMPGLYWFAANCDNATAVFESISNLSPSATYLIGSSTQNISLQGSTGITGLSVAQTFGTWPDLTAASFGEVIASNTFPIVQFKIASVP